jgi:hypothetical protein
MKSKITKKQCQSLGLFLALKEEKEWSKVVGEYSIADDIYEELIDFAWKDLMAEYIEDTKDMTIGQWKDFYIDTHEQFGVSLF